MELTEAMLTRRSRHHLTGPAPEDEEFARLLQTAAAAPDHGCLRPWRWILVRGAQRHTLGEALATGTPAAQRTRTAAKPLRAPLLASVVFTPRSDGNIPEWEQLAATASLVHSLELLLHSEGWGSIWRTGSGVDSGPVRRALRLEPGERLLGWLYIGTPDPDAKLPPKHRAEVGSRLLSLEAATAGTERAGTASPAA